MELSLLSSDRDLHHVAATGDVTVFDLQRDSDPLEELLGPGCYASTVLLNLEKTRYMDSAGIGWLIQRHSKFRQGSGQLILHSVPPLLDQMFQILKLHTFLHVASDEAAARQLAAR